MLVLREKTSLQFSAEYHEQEEVTVYQQSIIKISWQGLSQHVGPFLASIGVIHKRKSTIHHRILVSCFERFEFERETQGGKSNKPGADCKLKHYEAERERTWFLLMESSFFFELNLIV
ncbi:hypothetical protein NC652_039019 [Populus alba x Populus x berolinensis]|nr:hypothetical protein NC652_039019 [Populus alba x Populus x berolinensis]